MIEVDRSGCRTGRVGFRVSGVGDRRGLPRSADPRSDPVQVGARVEVHEREALRVRRPPSSPVAGSRLTPMPFVVWIRMSVRSRMRRMISAYTAGSPVLAPCASRAWMWTIDAPASRQSRASSADRLRRDRDERPVAAALHAAVDRGDDHQWLYHRANPTSPARATARARPATRSGDPKSTRHARRHPPGTATRSRGGPRDDAARRLPSSSPAASTALTVGAGTSSRSSTARTSPRSARALVGRCRPVTTVGYGDNVPQNFAGQARRRARHAARGRVPDGHHRVDHEHLRRAQPPRAGGFRARRRDGGAAPPPRRATRSHRGPRCAGEHLRAPTASRISGPHCGGNAGPELGTERDRSLLGGSAGAGC